MENSGGLNNLFGKYFKHQLLMLIPTYFDGIKKNNKLSATFKQCVLQFTRLKFKIFKKTTEICDVCQYQLYTPRISYWNS